MAKITRVQRTAVSSTVDPQAISRAAQTGEIVAGAFGALAERQERLEIASSKAEVAKANSELNLSYRETYNENRRTYEADPKAGQDSFNNTLNTISSDAKKNLTSDRARSLFDQTSLKIQEQYKAKRIDWEDKQITANVFTDIESASESYDNQAYANGKAGDVDAFFTGLQTSQDIIVAASGAVDSQEKLASVNDNLMKGQADAFIDGMIRDNPTDIEAVVQSGRLNDLYTPQERDSILDKANQRVENNIAADEKLRKNDVYAWLESKGHGAPSVNIDDPQSIMDRINFVNDKKETLGMDIPILSKDEVEGINEFVSKAKPSDSARLMQGISMATPQESYQEMAGAVFEKNQAYGAAMSIADERPDVSTKIVSGSKRLKEGTVQVPAKNIILTAYNDAMGKAITDPAARKFAYEAFKSYYADYAFDNNVTDTSMMDSDGAEKAFKETIGEVVKYNEGDALSFRGKDGVFVSPEDFNNQVDDLFSDSSVLNIAFYQNDRPRTVSGEEIDYSTLKGNAQLQSIGDGLYWVKLFDEITVDKSGNNFVLNMKEISGSQEPTTTEDIQDSELIPFTGVN